MSEGKYKIIDDGSEMGVKIFAPDGEDITAKISEYSIVHKATEKPRLYLRYALCEAGEVEVEASVEDAEVKTWRRTKDSFKDG